jgi:hypothetical protein
MSDYPAFKWTAAGECILVENASKDSPDYLNSHPGDAAPASVPETPVEPDPTPEAPQAAPSKQTRSSKAPAPASDMSRMDIINALVSGEVPYDPNDDTDVLAGVLRESLQSALTLHGAAFSAGDDLKTLYAKVMELA